MSAGAFAINIWILLEDSSIQQLSILHALPKPLLLLNAERPVLLVGPEFAAAELLRQWLSPETAMGGKALGAWKGDMACDCP
jgi:hypothetical protein